MRFIALQTGIPAQPTKGLLWTGMPLHGIASARSAVASSRRSARPPGSAMRRVEYVLIAGVRVAARPVRIRSPGMLGKHARTATVAEVRLLTPEQVAERLVMSVWWVYDHPRELGLVKIGGANRYRADRVDQYLDEQLSKAEPPADPPAPRPSAARRQKSRRNRRQRVPLLDAATGLRPEKDAA